MQDAFSQAVITVEPKYTGNNRAADFYSNLYIGILTAEATMQGQYSMR